MASSTAYILMLNAKTGVFTLISEKDELTIDKSHKKYEWLQSQETGRVIKISDKGRWNSARDYNNLYQSIKQKKKAPKKEKTARTNKDKAGVYCFSFDGKKNHFILTDSKGTQVQINSAHKKFEWLQLQETGRVIKISEKGKWNSSKDYNGLYDEINSTHRKQAKPSVTKPITQKPKSDNSGEIKKLKEEIKHSQSTIHNVRDELKRLGSQNNELKTELSKRNKKIELLENQIAQLKKKTTTTRTTSSQNKESLYDVSITALFSYYDKVNKENRTKPLNILVITDWLDKKPTQSLIKSYLKLALSASKRGAFNEEHYFNLPLRYVSGLNELKYSTYKENKKISEITFVSIEVRKTK